MSKANRIFLRNLVYTIIDEGKTKNALPKNVQNTKASKYSRSQKGVFKLYL